MAVGSSFEITGRLMTGTEVVGYRLSGEGKEISAKKEVVCFLAGKGRITNAECILNVAEGEVTLSGLNGTKLASLPKIEVAAPEKKNQEPVTTNTQEKPKVGRPRKIDTANTAVSNINIKKSLTDFCVKKYGEGSKTFDPRKLKISKIIANMLSDAVIQHNVDNSDLKILNKALLSIIQTSVYAINSYSKLGLVKKLTKDTLDALVIGNAGNYEVLFRIEIQTSRGPNILQLSSFVDSSGNYGTGAGIGLMGMDNIRGEYLSKDDCAEGYTKKSSLNHDTVNWQALNTRMRDLRA